LTVWSAAAQAQYSTPARTRRVRMAKKIPSNRKRAEHFLFP
jgi:hypothetical protein